MASLVATVENLLTYSSDFTHANWTLSNTPVVTADQEVAPDNTLSSDYLEDDDAAAHESVYQDSTSYDVSLFYTISIYIKKDSTPRTTRFPTIYLQYLGSTTETNNIDIDTQTGEFSTGFESVEGGSGVESVGDYWRVYIAARSSDGANTSWRVSIYPSHGLGSAWTVDVAGVGSIILWGAMVTEGDALRTFTHTTGTAKPGPWDGIELMPGWTTKEQSTKVETRHRSRDGSEFAYKWGDVRQFSIPVEYVSLADKIMVNSWWGANTALVYTDVNLKVSSVHIINKKTPIDTMQKPYTTLFKGKIELGSY